MKQFEDEMASIDTHDTGWIVAVLTAVWGLAMRIIIGRYNDHARLMREINQRLTNIEIDVAGVKGVLRERDRNGTFTWPHGHD
jgi:hypothetical protein